MFLTKELDSAHGSSVGKTYSKDRHDWIKEQKEQAETEIKRLLGHSTPIDTAVASLVRSGAQRMTAGIIIETVVFRMLLTEMLIAFVVYLMFVWYSLDIALSRSAVGPPLALLAYDIIYNTLRARTEVEVTNDFIEKPPVQQQFMYLCFAMIGTGPSPDRGVEALTALFGFILLSFNGRTNKCHMAIFPSFCLLVASNCAAAWLSWYLINGLGINIGHGPDRVPGIIFRLVVYPLQIRLARLHTKQPLGPFLFTYSSARAVGGLAGISSWYYHGGQAMVRARVFDQKFSRVLCRQFNTPEAIEGMQKLNAEMTKDGVLDEDAAAKVFQNCHNAVGKAISSSQYKSVVANVYVALASALFTATHSKCEQFAGALAMLLWAGRVMLNQKINEDVLMQMIIDRKGNKSLLNPKKVDQWSQVIENIRLLTLSTRYGELSGEEMISFLHHPKEWNKNEALVAKSDLALRLKKGWLSNDINGGPVMMDNEIQSFEESLSYGEERLSWLGRTGHMVFRAVSTCSTLPSLAVGRSSVAHIGRGTSTTARESIRDTFAQEPIVVSHDTEAGHVIWCLEDRGSGSLAEEKGGFESKTAIARAEFEHYLV